MYNSPVEIGLFEHPKLHALMDKLGHERSATCIGYLTRLWGYAMQHEITGESPLPDMVDLTWSRIFDVDRADGLAIRDAMLSVKFIEFHSERYWIHGWAERGGKYIDKMVADRERKAADRLKKIPAPSTDNPSPVRGQSMDSLGSGAVNPIQSNPVQSNPNQSELEQPEPTQTSSKPRKRVSPPTHGYPEAFDEFWTHWPDKGSGKAAGYAGWQKLNPEQRLKALASVQELAALWANEPRPLAYFPNVGTWFNQGRWEAEQQRGPSRNGQQPKILGGQAIGGADSW